jgi:hypothetical protein
MYHGHFDGLGMTLCALNAAPDNAPRLAPRESPTWRLLSRVIAIQARLTSRSDMPRENVSSVFFVDDIFFS